MWLSHGNRTTVGAEADRGRAVDREIGRVLSHHAAKRRACADGSVKTAFGMTLTTQYLPPAFALSSSSRWRRSYDRRSPAGKCGSLPPGPYAGWLPARRPLSSPARWPTACAARRSSQRRCDADDRQHDHQFDQREAARSAVPLSACFALDITHERKATCWSSQSGR